MSSFSLLSVVGIEIEYMLVDCETLDVKPCSDSILTELAGSIVNQYELGDIAVSNELVMHVIELKNNGPKPVDAPLALHFQTAIETLQPILKRHNVQLLPTGAHPWMNPLVETKRWPHDDNAIYQQYDKIFDCRGHGWSNLQSMHVNLPFSTDEEFNRLHNAIRLILPLLPAIAASSPFLERKKQDNLSQRLHYYDNNQARIPSISGSIIPDFISSEAEYQERILKPMYQDIRSLDPEKLLQYEWLNSRGAIPKFDYGAVEIRILDSQECVDADIAIAKAIWGILNYWIHESDYYLHQPCDTQMLKSVYDQTKQVGLHASVNQVELARQWQLTGGLSTVRHVWSKLIEKASAHLDNTSQIILDDILTHGNLSERIISATEIRDFQSIYRQLGNCLITNESFHLD